MSSRADDASGLTVRPRLDGRDRGLPQDEHAEPDEPDQREDEAEERKRGPRLPPDHDAGRSTWQSC